MIRRLLAVVLGLACLLASLPESAAQAAGQATTQASPSLAWEWLGGLPQTQPLNAITYGNGQFVAVGESGAIITSPDGKRWEWHPSGVTAPLWGVAYGNGQYVDVGGNPDQGGVVLTSPDGETWNLQTTLSKVPMTAITYGADRFLAVGEGPSGDVVYTSPDGEQWTYASGLPERSGSVANGDGRYVALTWNQAFLSEDGDRWAAHPLPEGVSGAKVSYDGTAFVAIATTPGGGTVLLRSPTGEDWTATPEVGGWFRALAYAGDRYLLVSSGGAIATWADASGWQTFAAASQTDLAAASCGGGICVAVGSSGDILTSTDLAHWTNLGAVAQPVPSISVDYDGNRFLAAGLDSPVMATSADGLTWTTVPKTDAILTLFYRNGQWLAGTSSGNGRQLYSSVDGASWTLRDQLGVSMGVTSIAYGNGRYVLGMYNQPAPRVCTADLKRIEPETPTEFVSPYWSVFGKGLFVGAKGNHILTAQDGLTWTESTLSPPLPTGQGDPSYLFQSITYGNGRFVAVASDGRTSFIYTSTDGRTWTGAVERPTGVTRVIYGGGWYLAWGRDEILTSRDGATWTSAPNRAAGSTFAYGAGRFIALGPTGTVMTAQACGARFTDLPGSHSACEAAEALADLGVLSGYDDGFFRPGAPVTRAELTKMLVVTLGLKPLPEAPLPMRDTAGHWAARDGYLQAAVAAGVINGFDDGTFRPDAPVTRAQLTKMVAAAAGLGPALGAHYADVRATDWFAGWVAAAHTADLIGTGGHHPLWSAPTLLPERAATRAESAILLDNLRNH